MLTSGYRPIYLLSRGGYAESLHFGAIAVVNTHGELIASYGDVQQAAFLRSAAKPFQVLPFVLAGGLEQYQLDDTELALMCASHSGTDAHVDVFERILKQCGLSESQLLCGTHPPFHAATAERLQKTGMAATPARHNCSGKHAGMLAYAKMRGWDLESYTQREHPLQQEIFAVFGELAGLAPESLGIGVDGCSAPNWSAPLYNTALAYARLADPAGLPPAQAVACRRIAAAMSTHADMVGGPQRFDTDLMGQCGERLVAKSGAEGFQAIGLRPGALGAGSPGVGLALKISDGDARNWASHSVALEALRQLGVLNPAELAALAAYGPNRPLTNWRGLEVGRAEPVFDLQNQ